MHAVLNEHWLVKADTIVEMYLLLLILLHLSLLQTISETSEVRRV